MWALTTLKDFNIVPCMRKIGMPKLLTLGMNNPVHDVHTHTQGEGWQSTLNLQTEKRAREFGYTKILWTSHVAATLRLYGLWSAHNLAEKARLRVLCGFFTYACQAKRSACAAQSRLWFGTQSPWMKGAWQWLLLSGLRTLGVCMKIHKDQT